MKKLILAAMVVALVTAGCGKKQKSATIHTNDWELAEVLFKDADGATLSTETPPLGITLAFSDSLKVASGNSGCNRYSAPYTEGDQNTLTFSMPIMTQKACPDMEFEQRYVAWFSGVESYAVTAEELQLSAGEVTLVYKPEFK